MEGLGCCETEAIPPEPNEKTILIVLSGGVERVGKTGVAIEVIDQVARRGTVC